MIKYIALLLAGIALLCLVPVVVLADECAKLDRVKSDVAKWNDGTTVTPTDVAKTKIYVAAFKARKAFSEITAVTAAIVHHPDKPVILFVAFGADGCAITTWKMSRESFVDVLTDRGI